METCTMLSFDIGGDTIHAYQFIEDLKSSYTSRARKFWVTIQSKCWKHQKPLELAQEKHTQRDSKALEYTKNFRGFGAIDS